MSNASYVDLGRINKCKIVGAKARHIEVRCDEAPCTENCFECIDGDCEAQIGGQYDTLAECLANPLVNSCLTSGGVDSGIFTNNPTVFWDWYFANHPNDPIANYFFEFNGPCPSSNHSTCTPSLINTNVVGSFIQHIDYLSLFLPGTAFGATYYEDIYQAPMTGYYTGMDCYGPDGYIQNTISQIQIWDSSGTNAYTSTSINDLVTYMNANGAPSATVGMGYIQLKGIWQTAEGGGSTLHVRGVPCICTVLEAECCYGPNGGYLYSYNTLTISDLTSGAVQIGPGFASYNDLVVWANANGCAGSVNTGMTFAQITAELSLCLCAEAGGCQGWDSSVSGTAQDQFTWHSTTNCANGVPFGDYFYEDMTLPPSIDDCIGPNGGVYTTMYSVIIYDKAYSVIQTITSNAAAVITWMNANGGGGYSCGMTWNQVSALYSTFLGQGTTNHMAPSLLPCYCTGTFNTCANRTNTFQVSNWMDHLQYMSDNHPAQDISNYQYEQSVHPYDPNTGCAPGPDGGPMVWHSKYQLTQTTTIIDIGSTTMNGLIALAQSPPGTLNPCPACISGMNIWDLGQEWKAAQGYTTAGYGHVASPMFLCNCINDGICDITLDAIGEPCECSGCGSGPGASWECYEGAAGSYCADPTDGSGQYLNEADCLAALATGSNSSCDVNGIGATARVNGAPGVIFSNVSGANNYYTDPANGISGTDAATLFFEVSLTTLPWNPCVNLPANQTCCPGPNSVGSGAGATIMTYIEDMNFTMPYWDPNQIAGASNVVYCCLNNSSPASYDTGVVYIPFLGPNADYQGWYGNDGFGNIQSWNWDEILSDAIAGGVNLTLGMNTPWNSGANGAGNFNGDIRSWQITNPAQMDWCHGLNSCLQNGYADNGQVINSCDDIWDYSRLLDPTQPFLFAGMYDDANCMLAGTTNTCTSPSGGCWTINNAFHVYNVTGAIQLSSSLGVQYICDWLNTTTLFNISGASPSMTFAQIYNLIFTSNGTLKGGYIVCQTLPCACDGIEWTNEACPPNPWLGPYDVMCDRGVSSCINNAFCYCEPSCDNVTYECDPKTCDCYDPGDGTGTYSGATALADCQEDCCDDRNKESWVCTAGGTCVDPGNGTGPYATAALCQASPGYTNCPQPIGGLVIGTYTSSGAALVADTTDNTHVPDFTTLNDDEFTWINNTPSQCPQTGPHACPSDPVTGCSYWRGPTYQPFTHSATNPNCTDIPGVTGGYFTSWEDCIIALQAQGVPVTLNNTFEDVWGHSSGCAGIVSQFYNPGCNGCDPQGLHECCHRCYTASMQCGCVSCGGGLPWECQPDGGCIQIAGGTHLSQFDCEQSVLPINSCEDTTLTWGWIPFTNCEHLKEAISYNTPLVDVTTTSYYIAGGPNGNEFCDLQNNTDCPGISDLLGSAQVAMGPIIPYNPGNGASLVGFAVSYLTWDSFIVDGMAIAGLGFVATDVYSDVEAKLWAYYGQGKAELKWECICCECTKGCPPIDPAGRKSCLVLWLDATDMTSVTLQGPPSLSGLTPIERIQNKAYNGIGLPLDLTAYYTWDTIDNLIITAPKYDTISFPFHAINFTCKADPRCQYLIANPDGPNPPRLEPDTTLIPATYGKGWSVFFHRTTTTDEWVNSKTWFMGDDWTVSNNEENSNASGLKPHGQPYCKSNYYGHNHAEEVTPSSYYESSPLNEINNTGYRTLKGGVWYLHWIVATEQLPYGNDLFDVVWGVGHAMQFKDTIKGVDLDMILANINTRNRGLDNFKPGQGWFSEVRAYNCSFDKYQVADELIEMEAKYGTTALNIPDQLPPGCGDAFKSTAFDGQDLTHIAVQTAETINPGHGGFTAAFWVRLNDCIYEAGATPDGCLFEKGLNIPLDNEDVAFRLLINGQPASADFGKLYWDVFGDSPRAYIGNYRRSISSLAWLGEASCAALVGKWKHVSVTMADIHGSGLEIYIDGVNMTGTQPATAPGGGVRRDSNYTLNIGDSSRNNFTTKANFSQFMTWNTELLEDEIKEVYSNGAYFDPMSNDNMGTLKSTGSPYAQADNVTFYTDMDSEIITDRGPRRLPVIKYGGVTLDTTDIDPVNAGQPIDIPGLVLWLRAGTKMLADYSITDAVIQRADYMQGNSLEIGDKLAIWECYSNKGIYGAQTTLASKPMYEGDGTITPLINGVYGKGDKQLKLYGKRGSNPIQIATINEAINSGGFTLMFRTRLEVNDLPGYFMGSSNADTFVRMTAPDVFSVKLGGGITMDFAVPSPGITYTDTYIFTVVRMSNGDMKVGIDGGVFVDQSLVGIHNSITDGEITHLLGAGTVFMFGWLFDFMFWKEVEISDGQRLSMYRVMNETVRTL